jgi:hypothetical protein
MEGMVRVSCPEGCDFFILGEVQEAVPMLWDHLIMAHHRQSVSDEQLFEIASCVIPARAAAMRQE